MSLTLTIRHFDNAAFDEDWRGEVADILRNAAKLVEAGVESVTLKDTNGNSVGTMELEPKEELLDFVVTYYEADDENLDNPLEFRCEAVDPEHAEEQCANAYPGCTTTHVECEGER